ncbi:hypothetical protein [Cellulomonas wangsupingiae]|uniref:Uncharacterized protein n=1 Tax=Cellulomonas wangsupingiae TaxID=2968085 RepID=A0ABY5K2N6_9CELL|nr:hypothetical protein [Cellulomonas wangsupingiae]MCC2336404.1 hypothetical protein [Cellulomonas wangsupingiae]MCM0640906.1 hypothetical protein [Cellulomonas wangsupingiae]UUI64712.1 hypothetical protein NP075_16595 [Cellulomonas wangsupingiae]
MNPSTTSRPRRKRLMVAGVIAASLSVAGATAAMAANSGSAPAGTTQPAGPTPDVAPPAAEGAAPAEGASEVPTDEQSEALWGAGYTSDDLDALSDLWQTDGTETKIRAGQMLLEGQELPVAPNSTAPGAQLSAFWDAGYLWEDVEALNELWGTEWLETKLRAGQALLDGQALPVPPSGTPAS